MEAQAYQHWTVTYEKNDLVQDTIHFWAIYASALLSVTVEMNNASKRHMYNTAISFLMRARRRWGTFDQKLPRLTEIRDLVTREKLDGIP